jgi:hypothetical protein
MNACLFSGARALSRFAIGDAEAAVVGGRREDLAAAGKAVIVCDVEVIDDVVLLPFSILLSSTASFVRLFSRRFYF